MYDTPITIENQAYRNFTLPLRSAKTKINYIQGVQYFMKYLGLQSHDYDALLKPEPKLIQSNIIDFTVYCKNRRMSPATVASYVTGVHKFYDMNDVELKWKKINSFQGEYYKVVEDRAYSHEELKKMIDIASIRDKAIILLMSSSGMRIGAVPPLRIRDLQKIDDCGFYKITVYATFLKSQYFTYCTPEARAAIDNYLDYRRRAGERIKEETPLFRKEFDKENSEQIAHPLKITNVTIYNAISTLLQKTGIREVKRMLEEDRMMRKPPRRTELQACHAMRKFTITNMIRAKLDYNIREKLTGHKITGMDLHYERLEESEFLEEYNKAIDFLTINNEARLEKKVQKLSFDRAELEDRISRLEASWDILQHGTMQ